MPDSTNDTDLLDEGPFVVNVDDDEELEQDGPAAPAARSDEPSEEEQLDESDAEGGQPRGPDGKFVKREPAETPSADTPPEGAPTAASPAAAPSPEAPAAPVVASEPTPFAFRAYGQQYPLEHAVLDAEGRLVVNREGLPRVQQMLARGVEAERLRAQLQSLQTQADSRAKTYDALDQLFASVDRSDPESVERFAGQMVEFLDQFPLLKLQAERDAALALAESAQRGPQSGAEADPVAQAPEAVRAHLTQHPAFGTELAKVGESERREIAARIEQLAPSFVRRASHDDALQWGVQVGEPIFDADQMFDQVQYEVRLRVKAAEAARLAQATASKNRRTTTETVTAPPSVSGGSAAPVGTERGQKVYASREEYDEAMES